MYIKSSRIGGIIIKRDAPSPLLTGLLAYWKLDNNGSGGVSGLDSTGLGRNLSAPNGTGGVSLGAGIINGSASFNGDESTYFSRDGGFLDGSRNKYSISAWVKTTIEDDLFVVDNATGNNWGGSAIGLDMLSDGRIYGSVFYDDVPNFDRAYSTTSINDGDWHHIAMTWDKDTFIRAYVDGLLEGQEDSSYIIANEPFENISLNSNSDGSYAVGRNCFIDEVGIWNKELSQVEITDLYNSGIGKSYPF
jgi:hypothetical protein